MRILLVTAYFRPHVGGVERFVETLASGLAERGDEVAVVCCRTEAASARVEQLDGYVVRRIPATNAVERRLRVPYPVPSARSAWRTLKEEASKSDVVHVHDALYVTSQVALRVAPRLRKPVLVTQHVQFVRQANAVLDAVERVAIRGAGAGVRRADRVVAYNPEVARWAERTWRLPRVDVLPTGVSVPAAAATREQLGLPPDEFVGLFVGRDVPKKGLQFVRDAVDPAYHLVAVTNSDAAQTPGLDLRPFTSYEQFAALLRAADALVLPSIDEGIPLVMQEAAVAGVPILTTRHAGYESYFEPDDLVFVDRDGASVRAALLRLAGNRAEHARLVDRVRAAAARSFDAGSFVDAYRDAYGSLVEGRHG